MKDNKVPVYHVKTEDGFVKMVLIDDLIELMKIMGHEIPETGFGLMPQDYMKLWNALSLILNQLNKEKIKEKVK